MENQDEGTNLFKEKNIQDQPIINQPLDINTFNIKEVNMKLSEDNNKINDIQENKAEINNEQLAVNHMDIEKDQLDNLNEQKNNENDNNQEENENKKERASLIRYPLAKIKNIMKLDSDIKLCQKDAYTIIGKVTEIFLQELARGAYAVCKSCKRKTINLEDINSAIKMDPKMGFINFNSIFYVQELNKIKKRATSSKNIEKNIPKEKIEESEKNINNNNEPKEKKKRGKTSNKGKTTVKSNDVINNKTLDSMFGL